MLDVVSSVAMPPSNVPNDNGINNFEGRMSVVRARPMMAGSKTAPAAMVFMKYDSTAPASITVKVRRHGRVPPRCSKRSPIQRVTPVRYSALVMMNNAMTVITAERLKPENRSAGVMTDVRPRLIRTSSAIRSGRVTLNSNRMTATVRMISVISAGTLTTMMPAS